MDTLSKEQLWAIIEQFQRPDVVMDVAERLLRSAGASMGGPGGRVALRRESTGERFEAATLAEAYAALTGGK